MKKFFIYGTTLSLSLGTSLASAEPYNPNGDNNGGLYNACWQAKQLANSKMIPAPILTALDAPYRTPCYQQFGIVLP